MKNGRVAVPSNNGGGLNCLRSGHFGHCDAFTLIDLKDGQIMSDSVLKNIDHSHGGCMVPVNLLAQNNVNAVIVGGIGRRPLIGFMDHDIDVYIDQINDTVNESVFELINEKLSKMSVDQSCGGGGGCH
jgi:predicted Fe-Mo cluster-binding NifX family protein